MRKKGKKVKQAINYKLTFPAQTRVKPKLYHKLNSSYASFIVFSKLCRENKNNILLVTYFRLIIK